MDGYGTAGVPLRVRSKARDAVQERGCGLFRFRMVRIRGIGQASVTVDSVNFLPDDSHPIDYTAGIVTDRVVVLHDYF